MGIKKTTRRRGSLRGSFALSIVLCILAALALSGVTAMASEYVSHRLYVKYRAEQYAGQGDGDIRKRYTPAEQKLDKAMDFLPIVLTPVWFIASISLTSVLFYRRKLQRPIALLEEASHKIAENDLAFTVEYAGRDELARLCGAFETMRATLEETKRAQWRQLEEHRRLSAAFSHDLRTPLTVLKGECDLLLSYLPQKKLSEEKVLATLGTMRQNVRRLEEYTASMARLQELEHLPVNRREVPVGELLGCMRESAAMLAGETEVCFDCGGREGAAVRVDSTLVLRVFDNLLSNALRYAKRCVRVTLSCGGAFSLTVADDGAGFSPEGLKNAMKPFYSGEPTQGGGHFGIGLNICQILCGRHGGRLELSSTAAGAAVTAVFGQEGASAEDAD